MLYLVSFQASKYFWKEDDLVKSSNTLIKGQKFDAFANITDKNVTDALYIYSVETNKNSDDDTQAYVAGFAEGSLTALQIEYHFHNSVNLSLNQSCTDPKNPFNCTFNPKYAVYVEKQIKYINDQVNKNKEDKWWKAVHLVMKYLEGMTAGYNSESKVKRNYTEFYMLNGMCDFAELSWVIDKVTFDRMRDNDQFDRCSGVVRITDDRKDVFFAHDSWNSYYNSFVRIAKTYKFYFNLHTNEQKVTFSSYPGQFNSLDDFYVTKNKNSDGQESNLAVLETTINNYNTTLFSTTYDLEGRVVQMWTRIQVANFMAITPDQWVEYFDKQQSYTYCNEYLVFDYKKYAVALENCKNCTKQQFDEYIKKNNVQLLHIFDLIPSHNSSWDATDALLEQGYFISINRATNESLNKLANYTDTVNDTSRFCIAKKQLNKINKLQEFKEFMRYNDYKNDDCSWNDPSQSIASRKDLLSEEFPPLRGAVDTKITTFELASNFSFLFLVGPIFGGKSNLTKWNFSDHIKRIPHPYGVHDVLTSDQWTVIQSYNIPEPEKFDYIGISLSIAIPSIIIISILWGVGGFVKCKDRKNIQEQQGLLKINETGKEVL